MTRCRARGIRHRYGSLGQVGSIPFVERVILTVKRECTRRILVPFSRSGALKELALRVRYLEGRKHLPVFALERAA